MYRSPSEAAKDTDEDSYEDKDDRKAAKKREIVRLLEAAQSGGLQ